MEVSKKMKMLVAGELLDIGAVFLRPDDPFTWASGIKSPIYTDNRLILTAPKSRNIIENALAACILEHFPDCQVLMGTATAGIAHAAIAAQLLGLPMGYVRGSSKDHGRQNRIEGKLEKGAKVVVVEDLISTGGSVLDAAKALEEVGAEVLGVVAIFSYRMEKGLEAFREADLSYVNLTDFDSILEAALEKGQIEEDHIPALRKFRDNPSDESWIKA